MTGIVELDKASRARIAPLFSSREEPLLLSYLQGHMGRAWAPDEAEPRCARVVTGDFCFFGGDARAEGAAELVRQPPSGHPGSVYLMIPPDARWEALIKREWAEVARPVTRYALCKKPNAFDRAWLEQLAHTLPAGYRLAPLTQGWAEVVLQQEWSQDLCSLFADAAGYGRRGMGVLALWRDQPVSGASSYAVYDGGIEIEIDTQAAHRRKGLAAACAARLILACLDKGLYPNWDAANRASLQLAQKLGYRLSHSYLAYELDQHGLARAQREPGAGNAHIL